MSSLLVKASEAAATAETRKAFIDACMPVSQNLKVGCMLLLDISVAQARHGQVDHDFVLEVAKKVSDGRKKVLSGVGQGIIKVCGPA